MNKPSNVEYEVAFIGTMLNYACNDYVEDFLIRAKSTLFSNKDTIMFFIGIKEVYEKFKTCDMVMLAKHLLDKGEKFDASLLSELTNQSLSVVQLPVYFEVLDELAKKRNVIDLLELTLQELYEDKEADVGALIHNTTNILESISSEGTIAIEEIGDLIISVMKDMKDRQLNKDEGGLSTTILKLDRQLGKMQGGQMIVLAARPAQGKTALATTIASNMLEKYDRSIHIFNFEMSASSLTERMLANAVDIEYNTIKGKYTILDEHFDKIGNFYKSMEGNVIIDGIDFIEIQNFKARCMEIKKKFDTKLIIVDYIQLMRDKSKKVREQEISSISRTIKEIAMKLDVPIIALAQLSRAVEQTADKIPMLSHLRESGAIEQDADKVVFLMRPEYYGVFTLEDGTDSAGVGYAYVRKNRNGDTGDVKLKFEGDKQRFSDFYNNAYKKTDYNPNVRIEKTDPNNEF